MANVSDQIPSLLEDGEKLTYANFAPKSGHGYPVALSDDWLVWIHRVNEVASEFDSHTPSVKSIQGGLDIDLIGNGQDKFETAKLMIVNGLKALNRIYANPSIPAADRIVTLDHNSQSYTDAVGELEKLIEAVRQTNDYDDAEDKQQKISELTAGRELLSATRVRVASARTLLEPTLRWFMEKFSGAIIGKIAGAVWDALQYIKIF